MTTDYKSLRTVKQIVDACPALTEQKIRWWIHNAEKLGLSTALVRVGGSLFIDRDAFNNWLNQNRESEIISQYVKDE